MWAKNPFKVGKKLFGWENPSRKNLKRNPDMDNYGISDALPNIANEKIGFVLKRLSELGVEDSGDLENVEVDDLTSDGLLKPIQARKLVKRWQKGIY